MVIRCVELQFIGDCFVALAMTPCAAMWSVQNGKMNSRRERTSTCSGQAPAQKEAQRSKKDVQSTRIAAESTKAQRKAQRSKNHVQSIRIAAENALRHAQGRLRRRGRRRVQSPLTILCTPLINFLLLKFIKSPSFLLESLR